MASASAIAALARTSLACGLCSRNFWTTLVSVHSCAEHRPESATKHSKEVAARLGVTKGSFYWHFSSRSELLAAALDRWERRTTHEAIRALDAIADHRRRLEFIIDAAFQQPRTRSLYAALAEAAEDPIVRAALSRVASARIAYLEVCYRHIGLPAAEAKSRAVFAYASYRGLLQLAHEAPESLPTDWSAYPAVMRHALVPGVARPRRSR